VLFMQGKTVTVRPLLSVVDDDEMLRESLPDLLREVGFEARAFSSGQEFLSSEYLDETRCLILDVAMPGMSGLDVQEELKRRGQAIPVICPASHPSAPRSTPPARSPAPRTPAAAHPPDPATGRYAP